MATAVVLFICLFLNSRYSLLHLSIYVLGLIINLSEQIINNLRFYYLSIKLDGMSESVDISGNQDQVNCLQQYIAERRRIPALGINWIHKKTSRRLSKRYEARSIN